MNDTQWISTEVELPKNGVVVDTKIDNSDGCRNEQPLKLERNLWWFPDGSMYVYYAPTHWREEQPEATRKRSELRIQRAQEELKAAELERNGLVTR
jgi:hypothetical protein